MSRIEFLKTKLALLKRIQIKRADGRAKELIEAIEDLILNFDFDDSKRAKK